MKLNLDEITKALGEITQGDWTLTVWGDCISIDSGDKRIGHVAVHDGKGGQYKNHVSGNEGVANAHLIANAPEWLRLLVERVRMYERLEETVMAFLDLQHNMAPYGHMVDEMYKEIAALAKEST